MVLILFAPASLRITVNSVCSAAAGAAAAPAAASHCDRGRCRCRNAEALFELLYQGRRVQKAKPDDLIFQLL